MVTLRGHLMGWEETWVLICCCIIQKAIARAWMTLEDRDYRWSSIRHSNHLRYFLLIFCLSSALTSHTKYLLKYSST